MKLTGKNYTFLAVDISKTIKKTTGMRLVKAHFVFDGFYMLFSESGLRDGAEAGGDNTTGTPNREAVTYEILIK